jgi:hypothetical protein
VKGVGAAFCYQRHLCPRALPLVRPIVCGRHSEFLNGVLRHWQYGRKCVTIRLIVHIDSVQCDITLIASRAIHCTIARILILVPDAIAGICDPGLQAEQIGNVSAFQRNLTHLLFVKGIPDRSVDQIQSGGLRCDRHDFSGRAHL